MNPEAGVFSTRSADRPNPIGLHRIEIVSIDGTPILDLKPALDRALEQ